MTISIIAAIGNNGVIGKDNKLPWDLPADMKHFQRLTMGKPIIMGQKTFESIGRPLPGRKNIILTRDNNFQPPNCIIAHSIKEALEAADSAEEVMICGGASVYEQFLPFANKMYLTLIHHDFDGDAFFPKFDYNNWQEKERIENQPDEENPYKYTFLNLERKSEEDLSSS